MVLPLLLPVITAFGVAYAVTLFLVSPRSRIRILDYPNERSLHSAPTPRTGGLAIWSGAVAGAIAALISLGARSEMAFLAGAAALIGVVSYVDDRFGAPAGLRFTAHLVAAGFLVLGGLDVGVLRLPGFDMQLGTWAAPALTILFVVWMTNLYNFMDGMDGFAGGMAVFGFGALGALGYVAQDTYFATFCWLVGGAAAGFLVLNFPPARIFMGDTGSSVLGMTAAAASLWGDALGLFPLWVAVLVFSPFIVDATVTLLRRALRGERLWVAHRLHYYQRLVQLGWGHKKTVLIEYGIMMLCAASALFAIRLPAPAQWAVIVVWLIAYACLMFIAERVEKQGRCSEGS